MDYVKLSTALSAVVGGICTGLVATHNMDNSTMEVVVSVGGIISSALAAILASFTGARR